jgi:hypothetical protein
MVAFPVSQGKLWKIDALHFYHTGFNVGYSFVAGHNFLS